MDPKNSPSASDKNETPLKDNEVINQHNTTPQDGDVRRTEIGSIQLPSKQPTKKFQHQGFFLPTLNFDSDTSDDLPYSPHTTIERSSKFDETHEEDINCCNNLREQYHNLYNCCLEEISDPLENNLKDVNLELVAKKQNKLDRLDKILAEQICVNEESPESCCEPREDHNQPPPPAHGESPWKQNQSDIENEQTYTGEGHVSALEHYEYHLKEDDASDLEEEEEEKDDENEQQAPLNSYKDELRNKPDAEQYSHTFIERPPCRRGERPPSRSGERPPSRSGERPPGRRGERPPGRRGERPCDAVNKRPSTAENQESNLSRNRYRMLNTPMRIGSAITSQSSNDVNSRYQLFRKNSDFPCNNSYYEKQTETSEYYSTLNTVEKFFETRLDITNNINSRYCSKKPTSISSTSHDNLPMHYSLEEMQYLGHGDISYPSTSSKCCNTVVKEPLPEENKHEGDL